MPKIYNQTILVPEVEKRWKIQTHQMKLDSLQRIWFCVRLSAQVNTYLYLISLHWIHNFELINSVNILEHKSNEVIYACVDSMTTITAKKIKELLIGSVKNTIYNWNLNDIVELHATQSIEAEILSWNANDFFFLLSLMITYSIFVEYCDWYAVHHKKSKI